MPNTLDFISTSDLMELVQEVVDKIKVAVDKAERDPHKNVVDPFSSLFEATYFLATGREDALRELYLALPSYVAMCCGSAHQYTELDPSFHQLFDLAFGVDKRSV